jgi:hypothetical protein
VSEGTLRADSVRAGVEAGSGGAVGVVTSEIAAVFGARRGDSPVIKPKKYARPSASRQMTKKAIACLDVNES